MKAIGIRSLVLVILVGTAQTPQLSLGQGLQQRPQQDEMFLMAPRSLMRLLREGEAAIADGRFTDGVNALGSLLLDDSSELPADLRGQDFFIEVGTRGLTQKSVKSEAIRLLSSLPEEGRRTLEIRFGVTARQMLDQAVADRDFDEIGNVARKYIHTDAGYDAQILMAQFHLTNGYPLAAASILQNMLDFPAARQRFGVQLAYAAAKAWLQAENRDLAVATLRMAARDFPGASLTIDGRQVPLEGNTDWSVVLESQAASLAVPTERSTDAWLTAGGSPQRNAQASAGLPLPNHRWTKEIHSSVPEREALTEVEDVARKTGNVILPKFELRMVDGIVITKTTDGEVLGIDFETGNIKWARYFGSSAAPLKSLAWGSSYGNTDLISKELQDRVWGSSAFGRFSCDHERFYYISSEGEQPINTNTMLSGRASPRDSNYLEGVSIAKEGAILWRVGGADGEDEARLAGAYFLGPPLAYEGQLYCLIEINGETKLIVLDPATGKLQWLQQLVHAVFRPIGFDEQRQAQALSPTIADGVVLCPTGVGEVVAVDLLSRSLRWGATYRPSVANNPNRFGDAFAMNSIEYMPLGRRWEDSAMIAERGIVVVSPPDSEFLFCREVLTGAPVVASQPRRTVRYVAGVHGDNLVLVSETGMSAINLRDKRVAWESEFPAGLVLAGKGLWQRDSMLIPLTGQTIVRVSLEDGSLTGQATVDQELGNLFAYRNQLLSVNSTTVAAFYTKESLTSEVEERLAANAEDTWALNQKSQLLSAAGNIAEAMTLLSKSYKLDPASADTRFLMIETLLEGLQTDFEKYAHLADEMDEVVELGPQRFRFLQQLALGKMRAGDHLAGFQRLYELMNYQIEMADSGSQGRSTKIRLGDRHTVDSDAWIASELARTYSRATPAEQQQMAEMIDAKLASVRGTMLPLRRQRLKYLSWLPAAERSSMELAEELRGGEEQTTAEQLLQPALVSTDADLRAAAWKLISQPADADRTLLGPAGRNYSDPEYWRALENNEPLPNKAAPPSTAANSDKAVAWKRGLVNYKAIKDYALYTFGRRLEVSGERYGRPDIAVALSDSLLAISNQNGENVGHLSFNPATSDLTNNYTRAHIRGGLLILETISEVVAFDLYNGFNDRREALLWRYSLVGAAPDEQFFAPMMNAPNAFLGITIPRRQMPGDQQATVGPLTPASLVVQNGTTISGLDPLTGKRLWAREGYGNDTRLAAQGLEVAIVNPSEGKTEVIDCRDGTTIRERDYRGSWTHWFAHDAMMVDFRKDAGGASVNLRIWNALTGEVFRDLNVSFSARAEVSENRFLVIAKPMQELIYIDLKQLLIREIPLEVDRDLTDISLERFGDRLVVLSDAPQNRQQLSRTPQEQSVSGSVYALDISTGDLAWSQPGKLYDMTFPLAQPRNSPFMVAYRFADAGGGANDVSGGAMFASVALIDLRDGHLAFADKSMLVRSKAFNMRLKPTEQKLELTIGDRNYQFEFTDEDRPPEPVFVFGHEPSLGN